MRLAELAEVEEAELGLVDPAPDLGGQVLAPDEASKGRQRRHPQELRLDAAVRDEAILTPERSRAPDTALEPSRAPRPRTEGRPVHAAVERLSHERLRIEFVGADRREEEVGALVVPRALLRLDH